MITGLFETHINVVDLGRSMVFYEDVLSLQLGISDEERRLAIYWIGGRGNAFLGLWEKPPEQIHEQHFAFEIQLADIERAVAALHSNDIATSNFFGEVTTVPSVFGWVPAASIYFRDPDGHELEFLAKLPGAPRPELGIVSWDEWTQLAAGGQ